MKARIECKVKKISMEDGSTVSIQGDLIGNFESDEVKNPDAKTFLGNVIFRVRPIVAENMRFGQKLYFTMSDQEPQK